MGVLDGQPVDAAVTNPAFINKNIDDTTPSRLGLGSTIPAQGPAITWTQQEFNSIDTFIGKIQNTAATAYPPWSTNIVGASTDSLLSRTEDITILFSGSSAIGHTHNGTDGQGPNLSADSIINPGVPNTQSVGTINLPGTTGTFAYGNHIHQGVHSISASGFTGIFGDAVLSSSGGTVLSQVGSDINIFSPNTSLYTVYVDKAGNDSTGNGTVAAPYLTISKALSVITSASFSTPYTISIGPGIFSETSLALKPWVCLSGSNFDNTYVFVPNGVGGYLDVTLAFPNGGGTVAIQNLQILDPNTGNGSGVTITSTTTPGNSSLFGMFTGVIQGHLVWTTATGASRDNISLKNQSFIGGALNANGVGVYFDESTAVGGGTIHDTGAYTTGGAFVRFRKSIFLGVWNIQTTDPDSSGDDSGVFFILQNCQCQTATFNVGASGGGNAINFFAQVDGLPRLASHWVLTGGATEANNVQYLGSAFGSGYIPTTPANWSFVSPVPVNVGEALNDLAAHASSGGGFTPVAPQVTILTAGATGSYSVPVGTLYLKVEAVGGGAGGGGSYATGSYGTDPTVGTNTTFGSVLNAEAGDINPNVSSSNSTIGGSGGSYTFSAGVGVGFVGGTGQGAGYSGTSTSAGIPGGNGGANPFGGGGAGGGSVDNVAQDNYGTFGSPGTGAGGGGGGFYSGGTAGYAGVGGGAGGYVNLLFYGSDLTGLGPSVAYSVGTGGNGGGAGAGGYGQGGAGAGGKIIITAYFQ